MEEIGLYFHVPFCTRKCAYCHFYVIPDKDPFKKQLMEGFKREWQHWFPFLKGKSVTSIYFGGGTPALLGAPAVSEILTWIQSSVPFTTSHPEITLEANPENITPQLMETYAQAGINRVSIGIQSLDPEQLAVLQRLHSAEKALAAVRETFQAGIDNISIDLMYDLPGQTLYSWQKTIDGIRNLPISHLSLYNLTIEPHTVFFKYREALLKHIPDQESSLQMYETAIEMLREMNLIQYEISAFAKNHRQAEHNVGYWIGRPFLGFGPSAFSFWNNKRFRNVANLSRYSKALKEDKSPIDFEEKLSESARRKELLAIRLRLLKGVEIEVFEREQGPLDEETWNSLDKLQHRGFITRENGELKLTKKGLLFYDDLATEII